MHTPSNIAIFSLAYAPLVGGAELAAQEIVRRLPEREFTCFTNRFRGDWPVEGRSGNMTIVRVGRGNGGRIAKHLYIFRAWIAAERRHRAEPFDAMWGIMAAYGGFAALLFKLRHPSVPFLLTLQEGDSETHILRRVGIFYPLWRLVFRRADRIQAISSYLADFGRRHGAKCPIEVVPNGVDLEKIKNKKPKIKDKDGKEKIIITTSRLVYKNGIDILIRAFAELLGHASSVVSYKLLILGSGPLEAELKDLAKELHVEENVSFLGHVSPEEIPRYLKGADVFVRPSRSEGLGSSFLEAMAAGLPVIGTPVGGIPDFLKDQETGLYAAPDDPVDFAEKISLLFEDQALREKIVRNGRALVERQYAWDHIAEQMNRLFTELCTS